MLRLSLRSNVLLERILCQCLRWLSPQQAKKPSLSFKFQKLASDDKCIEKDKTIDGKSSESGHI
jgi:hypothetical protein